MEVSMKGIETKILGRTSQWFGRNWDREVGAGFLVLSVATLLPVVAALSILSRFPGSQSAGFVLVMVTALLAVAFVATNWSRRGFLVFSFFAVVLFAAAVVHIGWESRATVSPRDLATAIEQRNDLEQAAKDRTRELATEMQRRFAGLRAAVDGAADGPVKSAAEPLLELLEATPQVSPNAIAEQVAVLKRARIPPGAVATAELYDAALAAVAAADDVGTYDPDITTLDVTIGHYCAEVGSRPLQSLCAEFPCVVTSLPPEALAVALANYRYAVDPSDANKEIQKAAVAEEAKRARGEEISWLDAAVRAPNQILPGSGLDTLVPGPVGWALLLATFFAFWNWQQRRNAKRQTGPVEVKVDEKLELLRFVVLHNLPEPAAIPGADHLSSVSDLVELGSEPAGKVARAVAAALKLVVGRGYGYVVEGELIGATEASSSVDEEQSTATPAPSRVQVRIRDRYTKKTIDARTFSGSETEVVLQRAGYWAAGTVLTRSRRQPEWLRWTAETAEPLSRTKGERPALEELQKASRQAPDSALLLSLLGVANELAGHQLDALQQYARAVALAPRFLTARYRLAGSLGMLAGTPDVWTLSDQASREKHARYLSWAFEAIQSGRGWSDELDNLRQASSPTDQAQAKHSLVALAAAMHESVRRRAQVLSLSWGLLRQSERDAFWQILSSPSHHRLQQRVARTARLVCLMQTAGADERAEHLEGLRVEAARVPLWWQLSYNAACGHAIANEPERAYELLLQTLVQPGAHQLSGAWVRRDPDLENLRGDPAWVDYLAMLGEDSK
jgi:tetratricopeptide (TPR) repeat protein